MNKNLDYKGFVNFLLIKNIINNQTVSKLENDIYLETEEKKLISLFKILTDEQHSYEIHEYCHNINTYDLLDLFDEVQEPSTTLTTSLEPSTTLTTSLEPSTTLTTSLEPSTTLTTSLEPSTTLGVPISKNNKINENTINELYNQVQNLINNIYSLEEIPNYDTHLNSFLKFKEELEKIKMF